MKSVEKCITLIILLITAFCNGCTFNNKQEEIKHQDCDWHLEYIHAPMMWAKTKGESITIAIIDSGIDYDFLGQEFDTTRIIATYNAFDCNNDLTDYTSHGTSMVSIIGASGENGFYGVAPACKFIIIKALNEVGTTNSETLIRAIDFAIENKANIINLSLGSKNINDNVTTAIMRAVNNNIVVTSAVGDQGKNSILFPALLDNTLSVAAIDCNGLLYNKSNFNESVDVLAPGVDVRIIINALSLVASVILETNEVNLFLSDFNCVSAFFNGQCISFPLSIAVYVAKNAKGYPSLSLFSTK